MIIFGEDLGIGANKLFGPAGGLEVQAQVAAEVGKPVTSLLGFTNRKPPMQIKVDGMVYYVGAGSHDWGRAIENLDYDRMNGVPETRAILYASLTHYMNFHGKIDEDVNVIVGLPLEPLSGETGLENAEKVKHWLKGNHSWEVENNPYNVFISDVKVTSQPSGALFDYLLDDYGMFISERKAHFSQEVGILSIGFNTIEILTVSNRTPVQGMTAGKTVGVRRLLELINKQQLYTLGELDTRLRAGVLDITSALPVWEREVTGQIEKVWGNRWKRFAQVIVVGGGALLLSNTLMAWFNGRLNIPIDPVMAISRGLYKQGLMIQNRKVK